MPVTLESKSVRLSSAAYRNNPTMLKSSLASRFGLSLGPTGNRLNSTLPVLKQKRNSKKYREAFANS